MVNEQRVLAEFMELVQISSASKREDKLASVLKEKLRQLDIQVEEDAANQPTGGTTGNLIAHMKGTRPKVPVLLLSSHMDSVSPCEHIEPVLQDGVIRAASDTVLGADDKAGLAAILEGLRCVKEQNIQHGDLLIVFTYGEEAGLYGSLYIDKEQIKADYGYVIDSSTPPGNIIVAAPGENLVEVEIHGKTAHAGIAPEEGLNAIVLAAKAIVAVPFGRMDEKTSSNIGIIRGGEATNIVPDRVELSCEVRSLDREVLESATQHMMSLFEQNIAAQGGGSKISLTHLYQPYAIPENAPVLSLAVKAMERVGLTAKPISTGGGSDGNHFNQHGIPTVVLGVGMDKVHTKEEYIKAEDLYMTARIVTALIATAGEEES